MLPEILSLPCWVYQHHWASQGLMMSPLNLVQLSHSVSAQFCFSQWNTSISICFCVNLKVKNQANDWQCFLYSCPGQLHNHYCRGLNNKAPKNVFYYFCFQKTTNIFVLFESNNPTPSVGTFITHISFLFPLFSVFSFYWQLCNKDKKMPQKYLNNSEWREVSGERWLERAHLQWLPDYQLM